LVFFKSQSIDDLIQERILQGFSTSFSYNRAGTIVNFIEVLLPLFKLAEFDLAYYSYGYRTITYVEIIFILLQMMEVW